MLLTYGSFQKTHKQRHIPIQSEAEGASGEIPNIAAMCNVTHLHAFPVLLLTHVETEKTIEEENIRYVTMAEGRILEKKNKIKVASASQISQLEQRLKIKCFELKRFGNDASSNGWNQ
ncbi:hypothetical protein LSH36_52g11006 [Paralvinella palmiformis]|uniref:Uncharacterized protein n=1 Tax=Paralvinella palmiformis TaxID=53620 RepID=A0AAD9NCV2_9ANNE|nr:hypothetical protein LSH36_52g11006 [Paralvinella palmiformis]